MTRTDSRVIVIGATNRPNDIDLAFLRRMPLKFKIPLPNTDARKSILSIVNTLICALVILVYVYSDNFRY